VGKNKQLRFRENETFALLYQPAFEEIFRRDFRYKGVWREEVFHNQNPIVLELGCGKGEYTVTLATRFPEKNFIGIDIKGARLWRGAKTATEKQLRNVAFVRTRIDFIESFFAPREVDEIWITFPDPQPTAARKRLTSPLFLTRYRQFLTPGGLIHLKTDSRLLHDYTKALAVHNHLKIWESSADIYGEGVAGELLSIKTHYEQLFLQKGLPITYLKFGIDGDEALQAPTGTECCTKIFKPYTRVRAAWPAWNEGKDNDNIIYK
jgi:tRNA (guanine-N7-)-methyltransferase